MVLNTAGPAPARGRYSRHQNAAERHLEQRLRVASAACAVLAEVGPHGVSVARIARHARVGRNTFYEHFTDVPDALEAAVQIAAEGLFRALEAAPIEARTPIERVRGFARNWFQLVTLARAQAECAFAVIPGQRRVLSPAGELLCQRLAALVTEARRIATLSAPAELPRLIACAAAIEGLTRALLAARISRTEAETTLVDVCVRLFR
jgi:AcrR family transcriptional regulator